MIKKIFAVLMTTVCLAGCTNTSQTANSDSGKLQVISTVFPGYDFARQICGDYADVSLLLPPGMESHSYEPSAQDIIKIQNCDIFICVGGTSEQWADKLIETSNKTIKIIKMLDCVNAVEEEIIEGMQADDDAPELDEHVWTSPANAAEIVQAIMNEVCEADPVHRTEYEANVEGYIKELERLDKSFADFFAAADTRYKTLIFGDRFPFRYFANRYSLAYYAAFPGCSAESEPSAGTIAFLIDKVKSENISTVFYIESSNRKAAKAIAEATGAQTALLHSCHNVPKAELENGVTYLSLMRQNLYTLEEAVR